MEAATSTTAGLTSRSRTTKNPEKAFIELARERFQLAQDADKPQRQRELEDLRFYAGDQWPDDVRQARAGQSATNGMPAVPARPCLTINKTREPVRQVLNQERQSDMGVELVPADDFGGLQPGTASEKEIELREGLVRRIQRESTAADARTWAFARSTIAGRGYYGVMTRFLPGKTWDQEICIHRFYNQASVSLDPMHEQPDGSDAEWGFVGTDLSWDQYTAEYGTINDKPNPVVDAGSGEWRALGDEAPGWFTTDGKTKTRSVRVVEYWYTVRETKILALLEDGTAAWKDELPPDVKPKDTRSVIQKRIKWAKIDGFQKLDETDWPGPDLPIVKVLGEELQPYDKERRVEGMVRSARDSQQGFNAMVSKWVESVALSPIPPFQIAEGQVEGYEQWYEAANTRTLPYLPYRTKDLAGNVVGPPIRTNVDTPVQAIAGSVQLFDEAIKSTTGIPDPTLGNVDPSLKSGKAIKLVQEQAARGSSNFLDNLKRSIRYEGQIINNLLYPIYGRPGRLARIVTGEGETRTILLHQPFTQQDGQPVPAQEGDENAQLYTLTEDASFNVMVKVTRAFDSRREEETTIIGDLLSAAPQLMTWFGDLFFKNQDGPGHQEMSERAKAMLDPKIQAMLQQQEQGGEIPPQVQAQMAQLQGQVAEMRQALQQAGMEKQAKVVEQQGKIEQTHISEQAATEREHLKQATALEKSQMDNETKLAVAELGAKVDRLTLFLEERARVGVQAHQIGTAAAGAGHDERMSEMGHDQATQQADQAQAHGLETLAAQPPPTQAGA